jgi:hypothetical protein
MCGYGSGDYEYYPLGCEMYSIRSQPTFRRNVDLLLLDYTALCPRLQHSSTFVLLSDLNTALLFWAANIRVSGQYLKDRNILLLESLSFGPRHMSASGIVMHF